VGGSIEVLYALPAEQILVDVAFEPGMTARTAVERSGLLERYPAIAEDALVLGVWGVEVAPGFELKAGDRVEISRPLVADPRDMRRQLVSGGRVMGGAAAPDRKSRKTARE
jgi:putative ubiquitin-RnfH superfamily antitoxin RatB of RatAB toxin-antitoxin module